MLLDKFNFKLASQNKYESNDFLERINPNYDFKKAKERMDKLIELIKEAAKNKQAE